MAGPAQEGHQPLGGRRITQRGHLRTEQAVVTAAPQAGHDLVGDSLGVGEQAGRQFGDRLASGDGKVPAVNRRGEGRYGHHLAGRQRPEDGGQLRVRVGQAGPGRLGTAGRPLRRADWVAAQPVLAAEHVAGGGAGPAVDAGGEHLDAGEGVAEQGPHVPAGAGGRAGQVSLVQRSGPAGQPALGFRKNVVRRHSDAP